MSVFASSPVPRLLWLLALAGGGLSLALVLPKQHTARDAAIRMKLPAELPADQLQRWKAFPMEVSKEELEKLADDTEFEKQTYVLCDFLDDRPGITPWHAIQGSIVLSGHDLNDSIHRPERCLPAQGYKDLHRTAFVASSPSGAVPISRVSCYMEKRDPTTGKPIAGQDGQPVRIRHVFYYWFVGSHSLTAGHYDRTLIDMKDRLVGGFDQRWAYVLLGGAVTDDLVAQRLMAGDGAHPQGRSESETDAILQRLVAAISAESIAWDRITP